MRSMRRRSCLVGRGRICRPCRLQRPGAGAAGGMAAHRRRDADVRVRGDPDGRDRPRRHPAAAGAAQPLPPCRGTPERRMARPHRCRLERRRAGTPRRAAADPRNPLGAGARDLDPRRRSRLHGDGGCGLHCNRARRHSRTSRPPSRGTSRSGCCAPPACSCSRAGSASTSTTRLAAMRRFGMRSCARRRRPSGTTASIGSTAARASRAPWPVPKSRRCCASGGLSTCTEEPTKWSGSSLAPGPPQQDETTIDSGAALIAAWVGQADRRMAASHSSFDVAV